MSTATPSDFLRGVFRHVEDDGQPVLVAINDDNKRVRAFRCGTDFPDDALAAPLGLNQDSDGARHNLYWGAASMSRELQPGSRGKEADIVALCCIVIDLDDPEGAARYERQDFPLGYVPTYVVRTSTGRYQLIYRLDEPCYDVAEWRHVARRLEAAWGAADTCSKDPAHVWRVPGTINWPNAKKRAAGRVPEMAGLVEDNGDQDFSLSDFEDLPDVAPSMAVAVSDAPTLPATPEELPDAAAAWAHLPEPLRELIARPPEPGEDRSVRAAHAMCWAFEEGATPEEVFMVVATNTQGVGQRYTERANPTDALWAEVHRTHHKWQAGGGTVQRVRMTEDQQAGFLEGLMRMAQQQEPAPVVEPEPDLSAAWDAYLLNQHTLSSEPDEPIVYVAEPLLIEGYIHMVHGPTGCGKSYFGGHIGYCLALGRNVGPYKISAPKKVLYIDAEMGRRTIKRRVRAFAQAYGPDTDSNFLTLPVQYIKRHHLPDGRFDLRNPQVQAIITDMVLRHGVDVLELDNVRSAAPGMEENDKESWDAVNAFLLWLRSQRDEKLTILWHHHDNKGTKDGGTTYAGSTHAVTNSEVRIALQPFSDEELAKLRERVEKTPSYTATAAIHVKFGKHREFEWEEHQPHDVAYIKKDGDPEHGIPDRVQMHSISEAEDNPTVMTAMQKLENVARGMAEANGKQNWRTLAGRMKAYYLVEYVGREQACAAKTLQQSPGNMSKWLDWMREDRNANVRQPVANVAKENTPAFAFD